jgi:hypothetical protein
MRRPFLPFPIVFGLASTIALLCIPNGADAKDSPSKKPFNFAEASRDVPKPRDAWPLVKQDMVPIDLKIISDKIVTSDTDPTRRLRKITAHFNSMKIEGKVWGHPCVVYAPADPARNAGPDRKGKVAIIGCPGRAQYPVHVAKYGDPITTRTGYPTMVVCNPGVYPDGHDIEPDIGVLHREQRRTGKYHYNMNCQCAVVYIQAMNAMEKILGVKKVSAVLAGHSKRGLSTPVAAAMDDRVASAIIMGNEGVYRTDQIHRYLSFHYPFYQDQVHVPVFYLGATNEDGYTMFNVNLSQSRCKTPMTIEMIPNYRHYNFSEIQYMDTLMWVAHTFDGRPLSKISEVSHHRRKNLNIFRAKVESKAKIQVVRVWYVYTDNDQWRDLMWYEGVMHKVGDHYECGMWGKTPDAFMVEVGDIAQGIPGYVSSLPQKLTDAPVKRRPGRGRPRLWKPHD